MIQQILARGFLRPVHHHGKLPQFGARHFTRGFDRDFSRGFGPGWSGRASRGDVKFLVLQLLLDEPRHGYEVIRAIEERRGFRPSAGSIYPTLQMLEEGGFVSGAEVDGKRVYTITDTGRELLASRASTPNSDESEGPGARRLLKASAMKLGAAVMGLRGSDDATMERARTILDRARREIYALLASDEA